MPTSILKMKNPDPFIMDEDTVNSAVANFLLSKEFECDPPLTGKQRGVDVKAQKGDIVILVESKGSQKNGAPEDEVFDHGQIVNHLARQIHTLMKYATQFDADNTIFVMANPDIPRIRAEYNRAVKMVQKMQFVCMWVQQDQSIILEVPEEMKTLLKELGLTAS